MSTRSIILVVLLVCSFALTAIYRTGAQQKSNGQSAIRPSELPSDPKDLAKLLLSEDEAKRTTLAQTLGIPGLATKKFTLQAVKVHDVNLDSDPEPEAVLFISGPVSDPLSDRAGFPMAALTIYKKTNNGWKCLGKIWSEFYLYSYPDLNSIVNSDAYKFTALVDPNVNEIIVYSTVQGRYRGGRSVSIYKLRAEKIAKVFSERTEDYQYPSIFGEGNEPIDWDRYESYKEALLGKGYPKIIQLKGTLEESIERKGKWIRKEKTIQEEFHWNKDRFSFYNLKNEIEKMKDPELRRKVQDRFLRQEEPDIENHAKLNIEELSIEQVSYLMTYGDKAFLDALRRRLNEINTPHTLNLLKAFNRHKK